MYFLLALFGLILILKGAIDGEWRRKGAKVYSHLTPNIIVQF